MGMKPQMSLPFLAEMLDPSPSMSEVRLLVRMAADAGSVPDKLLLVNCKAVRLPALQVRPANVE